MHEVGSKQLLCFVHGQSQKCEQKPTTKEFVGFHNHSPLLIVVAHVADSFFFVLASREIIFTY